MLSSDGNKLQELYINLIIIDVEINGAVIKKKFFHILELDNYFDSRLMVDIDLVQSKIHTYYLYTIGVMKYITHLNYVLS